MNRMIQRNFLGIIFLIIIFLPLFLSVSLIGCSSSSSGTSSTGIIKGFVTDAKTGVDLKGVLVSIYNSSTETDSDGHYILTGIPGGNRNVTASKSGYKTYTGLVTVAGGQTTFLDIQMTPDPASEGEIRGSVIDNNTLSSIEDAVISIGSATTTSNSDGSYHLSGIPSGVQIIKASKSGYQNYSGSVEVKAGESVFHDISMIPEPTTGTVRGSVTNKDTDDPIENALVSIGSTETHTDSEGIYQLTGIRSGIQTVIASKSGYDNYGGSVVAVAGATVFHDFSMTPKPTTGTVRGRVTDKDTGSGLEDAIVSISSEKAQTDSRGDYDITGVKAGTRVVISQKTGYENYFSSIEVKAGETVLDDIAMTPKPTTGIVRGTVSDKDTGNAIQNALVSIGSTETYTDSGGTYQLTGIRSGTQTVIASKSGYENYSGSVEAVAGETVFHDFSMTPKPTTGTVVGRVTDKDTGSGLGDAVVSINPGRTQTDSRGDYEIIGAKAGTRMVISQKTGFENYFSTTEVKAGETVFDDIAMTPKATTGSVKGIVTDKDTGSPVEDARVSIGSTEVRTDADGHFDLNGILAGTQQIYAQKTGYESYSASLEVKAGETVFNDIAMTPEPTTGTVRGKVIDNDTDNAIENALVSIGSAETYTDTEGTYHLTGIQSGTQTVIASKSGYENYTGSVEAVAGETVFHDFSMTPEPTTGTVMGRVTDKDTGSGLEDAVVSIGSEKTQSDSRGDYDITGVKAGTRVVISRKTGYENYSASLEVKAGETVFNDIAMTPEPTTGSVKGTVTDKDTGSPVGDALVSIGSTEVRTGSDGYFDLNGIPAGTQQIHAQKTGYENYSASLEVKAGKTVFNDIAMTPEPTTGTVRGAVSNKDTGSPVENALVSIGSTETYTDSGGTYQLTGIPSGTQTVLASHSGFENYSGSVEAVAGETVFHDFSMTPKPTTGTVMGRVTDKDTGSGLEDAVVSVSSEKTQSDSRGDYEITGVKAGTRMVISLKTGFKNYFSSTEVKAGEIVFDDIAMMPEPTTGSVKGIVTDKDTGSPVGDARVSIGSIKTMSDANGQYELGGIGEGSHEIDAQKAGYQNYSSTVTVTAGLTTFHDIQMAPEPTTGTVEGIVTDQTTGSALEGVRVLIGSTEVVTQSDGHYRLTGIDEGAHNILAEKSGYDNYSKTVTVNAGSVTIHDIHMVPEPRHGAVQGHVTDASTGDPIRGVTINITGTSTETETDQNGFYLITGVLAGTNQMVGREAGFETYEGTVIITAGQTITHDFQMTPIPQTGDVWGYVTDQNSGQVLAHVEVEIGHTAQLTDSEGKYDISGLEPGAKDVYASKLGYENSRSSVTVVAGQETRHDIELTPIPTTGTVQGTVTDASSGNPLEGVIVTVDGLNSQTGSNGQYQINGVSAGSHEIHAQKVGYEDYSGTVTVIAGQTTSRDIAMSLEVSYGIVYGLVRDNRGRGINRAEVWIGSAITLTDSSGYYQLHGISAGSREVFCYKKHYTCPTTTVNVIANRSTIHNIEIYK